MSWIDNFLFLPGDTGTLTKMASGVVATKLKLFSSHLKIHTVLYLIKEIQMKFEFKDSNRCYWYFTVSDATYEKEYDWFTILDWLVQSLARKPMALTNSAKRNYSIAVG